MNIHIRCLLWAAVMLPALAHAANDRPVEATRYVNAQGVEIFVPRMVKANEAAPAADAGKKDSPVTLVSGGSPMHAVMTTPQAAASTKTSPAATTSDEGRVDILMQELMTEQKALEVKRKVLSAPRADVDLAPADRQKVADDIHRHEENIRALGRELEQTRQASAKSAMRPVAHKTSH